MITIREYIEGKADLRNTAFGILGVYGAGTTEGALKGWDTRGRKPSGKEMEHENMRINNAVQKGGKFGHERILLQRLAKITTAQKLYNFHMALQDQNMHKFDAKYVLPKMIDMGWNGRHPNREAEERAPREKQQKFAPANQIHQETPPPTKEKSEQKALPPAPKEAKGDAPRVQVKVAGGDENVFAVLGKVSSALKKAGQGAQAKAMAEEVFKAGSYHEALGIMGKYADLR